MRKATTGPSGVSPVPSDTGSPLPDDVKTKMESKLGADLSAVRLHTGSASAQAASNLGARAFTVGSDLHFNTGEYAPGSKEGDRLLAHELTHAVQSHRSGIHRKADGDTGDGQRDDTAEVSEPHEPAEQEADAVADRVADQLHANEDRSDGADNNTDENRGKAKSERGHNAEQAKPGEKAPPIAAKLANSTGQRIFRSKKNEGGEKNAPQSGDKPNRKGYAIAKSAIAEEVVEEGRELVMNFVARTLHGAQADLGHGAVGVDEQGLALGYPHFTLIARVSHQGKEYPADIYDSVEMGPDNLPVGKGARTPFTQYALNKFLAFYKRRFGHDPEKLEGILAWSNKLNFQREWYKVVRDQKLAPQAAAVEAVKRISFGTHRMAVGYGKFEVLLGALAEVDLGEDPKTKEKLGKQRVPSTVKVFASKGS